MHEPLCESRAETEMEWARSLQGARNAVRGLRRQQPVD
jgi:hypothetical protein